MECDFLYDAGLNGSLTKDSKGLDDLERKALETNNMGSSSFENGVRESHPEEGAARETLRAWRGYESFA